MKCIFAAWVLIVGSVPAGILSFNPPAVLIPALTVKNPCLDLSCYTGTPVNIIDAISITK